MFGILIFQISKCLSMKIQFNIQTMYIIKPGCFLYFYCQLIIDMLIWKQLDATELEMKLKALASALKSFEPLTGTDVHRFASHRCFINQKVKHDYMMTTIFSLIYISSTSVLYKKTTIFTNKSEWMYKIYMEQYY